MIRELLLQRVDAPTFGGLRFGAVGTYEMLQGTAVGELEPGHGGNADIVNLGRAPRNAAGRVEYRVDVAVLKPTDMTAGNRRLLYDVVNRGGKRATARHINGGPIKNDPGLESDAGTGFLMRQGYTVVWSGWQADVAPGDGRMVAQLPVATADGAPIVGTAREEFIDAAGGLTFVGALVYPAADPDPSRATLTVRQRQADPRATPQDLRWRYVDERHVEVTRPAGFDGGAIYEFIYQARDPVVTGIAFASVRDLVAFLRHEAADGEGRPNPLASEGRPVVDQAMAVGFSQSGRFLRDFLYQGFNSDEAGRMVFEGVMPVIAGSRKTCVNRLFALPGTFSRQHETHLAPGDQFPFAYATITDPVSGRTDGILAAARRAGACPKVMHVDTDTELWQARASLLVWDGERPVPEPPEVRHYMVPGSPHGPYRESEQAFCRFPGNRQEYASFIRALLVALERWISDGLEPPASRYPNLADGTLVEPIAAAMGMPPLPGLDFRGAINTLCLTDHSTQPPTAGAPYAVLVNRVDADGNGLGGIRHPLLQAPLGTHTGWNLRAAGHAPGELAETAGAFFPFAATRAAREAAGDARPAVAERYPDRKSYLARVTAAAEELVRERLLLEEDAERICRAAAASFPEPA